MSRTKKAFYNMFTAGIAQIIAIVCGLITPRLVLNAFGSTYNGVINSVAQFLSVVSILRLGIAGATRVALYKSLANEDLLGTSRIMKATKQFMRRIAGIIVLYSIFLCVLYPNISRNGLTKWECALIICIVSISVFAEYFFGISNTTLLSADQAEYIYSILNSVALIINCCITALLIYWNQSIFIVKLGSSLVFFITPFALNWYVKKKYQLIDDCDPDDIAIKGRKAVAFHSIANIVHSNTDIIVLTLFTDAKIISVYTVYNMIATKLRSIVQIFTNGMEAAFGNMIAKEEKGRVEIVFNAFETGIFYLATVLFSCLGVLILSFIKLYTENVHDIDYIRPLLAVLITSAEAMYCIRQPYLILVQAAGCYEETKRGAMFEAIINLSLSLVLVNVIGINGVIVGTLVANVFRTLQYVFFISQKIINRSVWVFIKHFLVLIGDMLLIVCFYKFIIANIFMNIGWFIWGLEAVITFVTSLVISGITIAWFFRDDTTFLISKLKRRKKNE